MIKIYQGGSTGLEQQKAKRYPSKINSGIKKSIKDSLQKDFNFELVLVQCGYFFEAIEEGAILLNKNFGFKLWGVNYDITGFNVYSIDKYKKQLDSMNIDYCVLEEIKRSQNKRIERTVTFSTIDGAEGLIF